MRQGQDVPPALLGFTARHPSGGARTRPAGQAGATPAEDRAEPRPRVRLLAAASGGGHWEELLLVTDAFEGCEVAFLTTEAGLLERAALSGGFVVTDCNQDTPLQLLRCLFQCIRAAFLFRPHVVVTTGSAPGLLSLVAGRMFGARTLWIDSIANATELSLSGKLARRVASRCVTQWQALSGRDGPEFWGSVL